MGIIAQDGRYEWLKILGIVVGVLGFLITPIGVIFTLRSEVTQLSSDVLEAKQLIRELRTALDTKVESLRKEIREKVDK